LTEVTARFGDASFLDQPGIRPARCVPLAATGYDSDLRAALSRLRNTLWGGGARLPEQVTEAVTRSGSTDVQVLPVGRTMQIMSEIGSRK
jgi:hypothetical protein